MKIIMLSHNKIREAQKLADQRNNKKVGVKSHRINDGVSDYAIHFYGILGEMAVAEWLGLNIDSTHNPNGGDPGYDFKYNNLKVDVKYSRDPRGCLLFKNKARFRADIAVFTRALVRNESGVVQIVGWVPKDYFLKNCEEVNLGKGKTLLIRNNKLLDTDLLKNMA